MEKKLLVLTLFLLFFSNLAIFAGESESENFFHIQGKIPPGFSIKAYVTYQGTRNVLVCLDDIIRPSIRTKTILTNGKIFKDAKSSETVGLINSAIRADNCVEIVGLLKEAVSCNMVLVMFLNRSGENFANVAKLNIEKRSIIFDNVEDVKLCLAVSGNNIEYI